MKKIIALMLTLIIALSAHTANAFYHRSHVYGPRKKESTKRSRRVSESPEEKQNKIAKEAQERAKRIALREAVEKAKTITYSKVKIPVGAVSRIFPDSPASSKIPINRELRIESLCGFELGRVINLTCDPAVINNDGNMEMVVQLKRPFRLCTRAILRYSKINHGLYYIKLYSVPQEKMNDEDVLAEVEGMTEAFKIKFGDRYSGWNPFSPDIFRQPYFKSGKMAMWKEHTGQSLSIKAHEEVIDRSRTALKGDAVKPKVKRGWTFSVELVDYALRDLDVQPPARKNKETVVEGVDVL